MAKKGARKYKNMTPNSHSVHSESEKCHPYAPLPSTYHLLEGSGDEGGLQPGTTWDPWAPCHSDDDCPPGTFSCCHHHCHQHHYFWKSQYWYYYFKTSKISTLMKHSELLCNWHQNRCTECMSDQDCPDCGEVNFTPTFHFQLSLDNWHKVTSTSYFQLPQKVNFTFH